MDENDEWILGYIFWIWINFGSEFEILMVIWKTYLDLETMYLIIIYSVCLIIRKFVVVA